uniref:Ubiquitin carboxyl-terminal hydrolase n=1 Tax=Gouania willdenowi TaxID=441366 RepID=A0A8C5DXM4_GOUWI
MRLKDPFSLKAADMTKRSNKPRKPRDEDSSDEVSGLTCQHVSKAVDLNSVKKSILSSVWLVCSDCLRERTMVNGEPEASQDVLVCLKCGFQGCDLSGTQHAVKHHQAFHSESHCITISLSTWKAWCFECNEELSTHCNKKALAQTLDFLQKHSLKATSASPKIMKLQEEPSDYADPPRGKSSVINSTLAPVKGINNLGNTCFFNAVMQVSFTAIVDKSVNSYNLCSLTVGLPNPEPLTAAMFVFLQSMKESGKGPLNPKALFNQLCQKAPRFKGYQQQDSQELLHYLLDSIRMEETKVSAHRTCTHMLAYGKEGVKLNFVDRIFVGELTNTIMCEECSHISTVKEAFIDISLPIIEERVNYKKLEKIYTSARKQMLISLLPPVITLHLKRFHQAGMNLRKVNRHVDFPLVLDLAPFCSASCKNLATGERVLYSLYGIVEHSGSMRGGHYTAYVKVRTPQRKSELHNKNLPGARDSSSSSQGQWVYVSDTTVQTVPESRVLNSQAYLLFYEELL